MARKGIYEGKQGQMFEDAEKICAWRVGWAKDVRIPCVTAASIKTWTDAFDCFNPLYNDPAYAARTRWGGIIAPPLYAEAIQLISWMPPLPDYDYGAFCARRPILLGEDWDMFKPIRAGDEFRAFYKMPVLEDITSETEDEPLRQIKFEPSNLELYNQKDELVGTFKCRLRLEFGDVELPPTAPDRVPYCYSQEELDYVYGIANNEVIRGANTLWFEDVEIGECLTPVSNGPTTMWDMVVVTTGRQDNDLLPMTYFLRNGGRMVVDPATNISHHSMEMHHNDLVAQFTGNAATTHAGAVERNTMVRLVTNWHGDDGWLEKFHWRILGTGYVGDFQIAKGRVKGKRVVDGRCYADLDVWIENQLGFVGAMADVSVLLPSRALLKD